jgi:hypothetical protein
LGIDLMLRLARSGTIAFATTLRLSGRTLEEAGSALELLLGSGPRRDRPLEPPLTGNDADTAAPAAEERRGTHPLPPRSRGAHHLPADNVDAGDGDGQEREPPRPTVTAPRPRAPARSRPRAPAPPPPRREGRPAPTADHVDEEPVLVGEFAGPGAAEGAGASVHVEPPWEGYDAMRAREITDRVAAEPDAVLSLMLLYEGANRNRRTIVAAAERELERRAANTAG